MSGRRRPSWCRCSSKRACPRHAAMAAATERAFEQAEKQMKPTRRPEPEQVAPRPPMPGDDAGYRYDEGRYAAGFEPEGIRLR